MVEMLLRELKVSCRVLDEEAREVEFTAATETPCDMGDGMPEVLRISGAAFDASIPLLNAHSRKSVFDVLGRATPRKEGRELVCRAKFSKGTNEANAAWALVKEGTLDAVSVGYFVNEYRELAPGETDVEDDDEKSRVAGPANVVTSWQVKELSLVPIGADPNARRRAFEGARKESAEAQAARMRARFATHDRNEVGELLARRASARDFTLKEPNDPKLKESNDIARFLKEVH